MAVYNGEKYLKEQLESILFQLGEEDEIIISVDPSHDGTLDILKFYRRKDKRIRVCHGPGKGVVNNFENAIRHCKNEIIFLADQDDVWNYGKVDKVLKVFSDQNVTCVLHNAYITDKDLNVLEDSFFELRKCRKGIIHNIIKNSYMGCCMAFRKNQIWRFLPFPAHLPMHDQWIGICCEYYGCTKLLKEPLIKYRRHEHNVSALRHASLIQMFIWRKNVVIEFIKRIIKNRL